MIGASTKMIADVEDLEAELAGGVELVGEAVLALLRADDAVAVHVRPVGSGELVLELLAGRDLDRPVVLDRALREVVDRVLEVLAQLGPLLGQLVVLPGGQGRHEDDRQGHDGGHAEVGEGRARGPGGCAGAAAG